MYILYERYGKIVRINHSYIIKQERSGGFSSYCFMKKKIISTILIIVIFLSIFIFSGCQNIFNKENVPNLLKPTVDYSGLPVEEQVEKRTEDRYGIDINYLWEKPYDYYTKYTFIPENGVGGQDEFDVWAYNNASGELVLQDNYQSVLLREDYEKFLGEKFKTIFEVEDIKVFVEFDNNFTPGEVRWMGYSYWPINYPVDTTIEKAIDDKIDLNAEIYVICLSGIVTDEQEDILQQKGIDLMEHLGIRGSFQFIFAHQKVFDKATRDNTFQYYHQYVYDKDKGTQGFRFDIKQPPLVPNTTEATTKANTTGVSNNKTSTTNNNSTTGKTTSVPSTTAVTITEITTTKPTTTMPSTAVATTKPITTVKQTITKPTTTVKPTTNIIVETTMEVVIETENLN